MGYYGDEMAHLLNRQPPLIQLWPPTAKGNRYCCHGDKRCGPLARVANISYMEGGYENGNFFFSFFFFFSGYDPIHWNGSTRTCLCYNVICDKQPPLFDCPSEPPLSLPWRINIGTWHTHKPEGTFL